MSAPTKSPEQHSSHSDAPPTLIFLHIPKTAGTTLSRVIERQYPRRHTFTIMPTPGPYSGAAADLERLPPTQRAALRLLQGHMPFGLHRSLPGPYTYVTFMRDPLKRVLSHYAHARRDPRHNLYPYMSRMTLKEALKQRIYVAQAFDNFQTRLISGAWHTVPFGELDESVLQTAKENLQRTFSIVGLVERFDESLLLLQQQFGWRAVYYTRHNTATHRRRAAHTADQETLELVNRYNRLDRQLYRFAADLYARQIKDAGPHFPRRLRRFQRINQFVSPFLRLYWQVRKVSVRAALSRL